MMKLLYVTHDIFKNTSANLRDLALIEGLLQNDVEVDLLYYQGGLRLKVLTDKDDLTDFVSSKDKVGHAARGLFKNNSLKVFLAGVISKLFVYEKYSIMRFTSVRRILIKDVYDVIVSSSDPKYCHKLTCRIIRHFDLSAIFCQIWGDPFVSDISRRVSGILKVAIGIEEKKLLASADKVFYLSKLTLTDQVRLYPSLSARMDYFYPPYLKEDVGNDLVEKLELRLIYTGDYFSHIRRLEPLYKAVLGAGIKLSVIGSSDLYLESANGIEILPRMAYEDLSVVVEKSNVNVVIGNLRGSQIPGKLFHCFGSSKPTLLICESSQYDFFKKEFGTISKLMIARNDVDSILASLNELSVSLGTSGILDDNYSPKKVASLILEKVYS